MVTHDSHRLANEPDSRESDTDSYNPICESTNPVLFQYKGEMLTSCNTLKLAHLAKSISMINHPAQEIAELTTVSPPP